MPVRRYILAILVHVALADVKFLAPAAGALYSGGTALSISWEDSGEAPLLSTLKTYGINLCAGGNAPGSFDCTLAPLVTSAKFSESGNSASVIIPDEAGQSISRGYFLQMVSNTATGEQVTNYSPRFSLNAMSGHLSQHLVAGVHSIGSSTEGPGTTTEDTAAAAAPAAGYDIPYNMQHGLTRYAPMQPIPGTAITAQNPTPLWPTSAFEIAKSYLPRPHAQTTITEPQTFAVASHANTAAAQPLPMDDMQKFLNRWKD